MLWEVQINLYIDEKHLELISYSWSSDPIPNRSAMSSYYLVHSHHQRTISATMGVADLKTDQGHKHGMFYVLTDPGHECLPSQGDCVY